jgi:hypothetical protein
MVIISQLRYPTESVNEVAKRFLEAPQPPSYLQRRGPYISSNLSEGISVISIYELDKHKLADGMEFIGAYLARFFGIPGFKYEYKVHLDAQEAIKSIGM